MAAGDAIEAVSKWDQQAIWHSAGSHELARDYRRDEYFHMLDSWRAAYPGYDSAVKDVRDYGDHLAVVYLESTGGMAPGLASGIHVYQVVAGVIREGWGIPAFESGRFPF